MTNNRLVSISLTIIVFTISAVILRELRTIFIPLTFAIFISLIFGRPVKFLSRHKVPMFIIIILVLLTLVVILSLGGVIITSSLSAFAKEFPRYEKLFYEQITEVMSIFKIGINDVTTFLDNVSWNEFLSSKSISNIMKAMMGNFANILSKTFLTFFFLIFLISGKNVFVDRIVSMFIEKRKNEIDNNIVERIENQLLVYMSNKTIISVITSVLGMLAIMIFKVDFIIVSGLFLFVLNFIPNFGSIIASIFPLFICFFEYGFGIHFIGLGISLFLIQIVMGNFVEPKLLGKRLNLSAIIILISLIFWAWVWGAVGMILAVPITSTIAIIIGEFDSLQNISKLIRGE